MTETATCSIINIRYTRMRYITRIFCGFPVIVLSSFYATWMAGRLALGYWPRSSFDDPKHINGSMMWLYHFTQILLFIGIPLFCLILPILILYCLIKKPDGWKTRLVELMGAVVLSAGFILFAKWDPQSVIEWFFD
jgi:hypothetical protein